MLAEYLQVPQEKAGRIFPAVLHALRNWLSMEELVKLLSQFFNGIKKCIGGWMKNFCSF